MMNVQCKGCVMYIQLQCSR